MNAFGAKITLPATGRAGPRGQHGLDRAATDSVKNTIYGVQHDKRRKPWW